MKRYGVGGTGEGAGKVFKGVVLAFEKGIYNRQANNTQQQDFEVSGYV